MTLSQIFKIGKAISETFRINHFDQLLIQIKNSLLEYLSILHAATNNLPANQTNIITARNSLETQLNRFLSLHPASESFIQTHLSAEEKSIFMINPGELTLAIRNFRMLVPIDILPNIDAAITSTEALNNILTQYQQFKDFYSFASAFHPQIEDNNDDNGVFSNSLSIIFEDEALITKLSEVSIASKDWGFIINCFARLVNETDTDAEIISVKRGSLIIIIASTVAVIGAICKASDKIVKCFLMILNAKQSVLELEKTGLYTKLEIDALKKKQAINVKKQAQLITNELLEDYLPDTTHPDYHEIKVAVKKAVEQMIRFENKGGRIDANLIEASLEYQKIVADLRERNIEHKMLRSNVASLIEGKQFLKLEENNEKGEDETDEESAV